MTSAVRDRHPSEVITCPRCPERWTANGAAHCAACHRTFSTARLFDLHRSTRGGEHGSCLDPETLTNGNGERLVFNRDGMFRGPEMTDEQKAARFGAKATT